MAAPVVIPLIKAGAAAAPVAKALGASGTAKAGAVLRGLIRNGPTLLRMVDQFRAPPSLGPQVADTPRRDRLRDLVADAIAGAQLGVASLPNPQLPGGNGGQWLLDALTGNLPLRALGAGLGQLWGLFNSRGQLIPDPEGPAVDDINPTDFQYWRFIPPDGSAATAWSDTSQSFPVFTTLDIAGLSPRGAYAPWSAGSSISFTGWLINGIVGRIEVISATDGSIIGLALYTWPLSGNTGSSSIINTFVTDFGGGSFELSNDQSEITPWAGVDFSDSESGADIRDPATSAPSVAVDPWFAGLPSVQAVTPAPLPQVATGQAAGANPLPPAGAVTVPSNPPADWFAGLGASGVPAVPGSTPGTLPGQVPTVQPLPAFVPRPVPGPSPAETQPETQPQVAPTTLPTTTPTTPATTPGAVPVPGPAGRPLTDAGTVPAPVQLPIPTTDPNFHFPVPGAPPVTGVQVRPDLKNIAKEVGRLEQKAARMLENQSDAEGKPFDLSELLRLLRLIWELLSGSRDGGEYAAIGVCEVDINGNPLDPQPVIPVPFAGAGNPMDAVSAKVDAIAQLLQEHKQLRQPTCRPPKAQGQPVTVFFEDLGNG